MAARRTRSAPSAETLAELKVSPEVAWYLGERGIALPEPWQVPLWKTPEARELRGARFNPDRVDRVLSAFGRLVHTQGRWAGRRLTPDPWQVAYLLAPVFGWERFGVQKPPEYASAAGFAEYVRARNPEAVFVLLTHDHPDHMGDYFEMLSALSGAGVNVKTVGLSDLLRSPTGLLPRFRDAGLDPAQIVAGANFGGRATHGAMQAWPVPAVHSTTLGYPAAGFILDIGGVRLYASGDADLFGDLRLIGERYRPSAALVCAGDGPFTMDPRGAAMACQLLGVSHAIPRP